MEGDNRIQFGLLRKDNTPRLSYVAFAALGRLLAGGRCLGRWEQAGDDTAHVYAFRARPDGQPRDVLVAWVEKRADWPGRGRAVCDITLPEDIDVEAAFDYLGRPLESRAPGQLRSSPVFLVLPEHAADALELNTIAAGKHRGGEASPVVFQLALQGSPPEIRQEAWTQEPVRVFTPGNEHTCALYVYNLSHVPVQGRVNVVTTPGGWQTSEHTWNLRLEPMAREALTLTLSAPEASWEKAWIHFRGDFGTAGKPILAFRAHAPASR